MPRWISKPGVRNWLLQRITAVLSLVYLLFIAVFFIQNDSISYSLWHNLFYTHHYNIFTLIIVACLLLHAWIGLWTVITDYVPNGLRPTASSIILLFLVFLFGWAWIILLN